MSSTYAIRTVAFLAFLACILVWCIIGWDIVALLELNLVRLSLLRAAVDTPIPDNLLHAVGERPEASLQRSDFSMAVGDEMVNPNWHENLELDSVLATNATARLEQRALERPTDIRTRRLLGRLQLYTGNYGTALQNLKEVARDTNCTEFEHRERRCFRLWIDIGDALDGLGMPETALQYYLASGLEGRREAAAELALRLGDAELSQGNVEGARIWYEKSQEWLPNALATQYSWLSVQPSPDYSSLRYFDKSVLRDAGVLQLHADPRIERRNAETAVKLFLSGVWDRATFNRVQAFRVWQLDRQSLDSNQLTSVWMWTPSHPRRLAWERSAKAYFENLIRLLPYDPYMWYYLGEVLERQGMCEDAQQAYLHAYNFGLPRDLDRTMPLKGGPCTTDHRIPITPDSLLVSSFTIDFEHWMNYGQALNLTATSTEEYGYPNQYPVRWVFGPDTLRAREGRTSFRADCLWQYKLPGKTPAFLVLSVVDVQKGEILPITVSKEDTLEVDYWWQTTGEARLEFHPQEVSGNTSAGWTGSTLSDAGSNASGWQHTTFAYRSYNSNRILRLQWYVMGCGTVWLDNIRVTLIKSGQES